MRRWWLWAAVIVVMLPILYLGAGLAGGLWLTGPSRMSDPPEQDNLTIGLIAGPIHYDLMLPLRGGVGQRFDFAAAAGLPLSHPAAEWVLVGWGAKEFYTSTAALSDMQAATVWQAATGDSAVMRLDVLGPVEPNESITFIRLSPSEMDGLITAVLGSFSSTTPLPLPGFTATDAFFPAKGRFNMFNTCNVWVGHMLRAAGLPFGRWTPFPQSIRLALDAANLTPR
jgi:uncharacterized protein (TIGR02117 family)